MGWISCLGFKQNLHWAGIGILVEYKEWGTWTNLYFAQLAGAVEYTDYISAEGYDPPNKCLIYDTKQSDGEVPVMLELWGMLNWIVWNRTIFDIETVLR